jgi:phosphonate transport system substrate-binding protein
VPGYQAFAKEKDRRIQGILVVLKDSHYQRPEDLDGQTLVFPAPAAFAASVLPRAALRALGIQFTPKYVASHDSVYLAVAKGLYPAGGGIARTLETIAPETRERLRILWKTDTYTPHAIAAHPRVPAEVVRRLQQAMVDMEQHPEGRELLQAIGFKGIAPAEDADWDDIRALGITELDELVP